MLDGVLTKRIVRLYEDEEVTLDDEIVEEYPLTIFLNEQELVTLLCTPNDLKELIYGFLYAEGLIKIRDDLLDLQIDKKKGVAYGVTKKQNTIGEKLYKKRIIPTGCGKNNLFLTSADMLRCHKLHSDLKITREAIHALMRQTLKSSAIFKATGAVHMVSVCTPDEIIIVKEDVARHNAVDRVIGHCLLNNIATEDKILMATGRISSEMLLKAAKLQIAIIVSKAAPTSLAVEFAEQLNITLIGFVRGAKMNIYTHKERVIK